MSIDQEQSSKASVAVKKQQPVNFTDAAASRVLELIKEAENT